LNRFWIISFGKTPYKLTGVVQLILTQPFDATRGMLDHVTWDDDDGHLRFDFYISRTAIRAHRACYERLGHESELHCDASRNLCKIASKFRSDVKEIESNKKRRSGPTRKFNLDKTDSDARKKSIHFSDSQQKKGQKKHLLSCCAKAEEGKKLFSSDDEMDDWQRQRLRKWQTRWGRGPSKRMLDRGWRR